MGNAWHKDSEPRNRTHDASKRVRGGQERGLRLRPGMSQNSSVTFGGLRLPTLLLVLGIVDK